MRPIFTHGDLVKQWVVSQLPSVDRFADTAQAMGVVDDQNNLRAGIIYDKLSLGKDVGGTMELSVAADSPLWPTREVLRFAFGYPFLQLGCHRIFATTTPDNDQANRILLHLGFVFEGRLTEGYPDRQDANVYRMLRRECRWIGDRT